MVAQVSECEQEIRESHVVNTGGNSPSGFPFISPKANQHNFKSENRISQVGEQEKIVTKLKTDSFATMAQEDTEICKAKKKKKFKPADELWCFSVRDHRYELNETNNDDQEVKDYIDISSCQNRVAPTLCWDEDCELAAEVFLRGRAHPDMDRRVSRKNKVPKLRKQLKDIQFNVDLAKQSKTENKPLMVKCDIYSRKMQRDEIVADLLEAKKANIEKNLKLKNLERRGVKKVTFAKQSSASTGSRKYRSKGRWSYERKEERKFQWEVYPYALIEHELDHADKSDPETQLMWTLIQLQHRELTPEDYDLLLQLDEKVAAKTVAADKLKSLKTQTLSDSDLTNTDAMFGDPCSICMEKYNVEQTVKFLPCNHVFHELCIDNWLTNSGTKCPLDGLEVNL